jgi:hypothetical protein
MVTVSLLGNSESTSLTVRVGAHLVKLFGIATTLVSKFASEYLIRF